ncbi:MAG: helix-turn-helix domain-containing protein [Flavobacteriaceae bacterium]|nr:helix-turn-helix domain-containing protein [Flavobacteriaceae bacterium]
MLSQQQQILIFLRNSNTGITSWDAIQNFRCTRLADIIFKLKEKGYGIETIMEQNNGSGKRYARYYLIKEVSL